MIAEAGSPSLVPVTVIVLSRDEEANIGACLDSVAGWAREVFVVDSGSTDRTVEIAERRGARVLHHPFEDYARQRNWAMTHLPITSEWELHLDADERMTPELRDEIGRALATVAAEVDGLLASRRTVFMGRFIRHGGHYPAYHLRLFRRGRGRCESRLYDQHFLVDGRTALLRGDIVDTITSDLDTWIARHNRWSTLEARQSLDERSPDEVRARLSGTPIERRRWLRRGVYDRLPLFIRAALYFQYRYVLRRGFLDGRAGLIFHFLQGFWFRFLIDAKIFEMNARRRRERCAGSPAP
jgi:glycosyltransferase involved in cell wall biosynthesis